MPPEAGTGSAQLSSGVTVGVTGRRPRWTVSPWGGVTEWATHDPIGLEWYVAADDRWHVPADEPTVRQRRLEGTPVVETRIRVPDGDAVQRVWAVPELDGAVVVEVENDSPLPFAAAFAGAPVLTERPPSDVPIQGIDLPGDAIVLPVGHRSTVRVVLPSASTTSAGRRRQDRLERLPDADAVVRGWTTMLDRASRLQIPDETLAFDVAAARCDLMLEGPVERATDPCGFLLDVGELVRCGDDAEAWLTEIVGPVEEVARVAPTHQSGTVEGDTLDAVAAALSVAIESGDDRAAGDLRRLLREIGPIGSTRPSTGARFVRRLRRQHDSNHATAPASPASFAEVRRGPSVGRFVRSVERLLADPYDRSQGAGDHRLGLLPRGVPTAWLGSDFDVHGLPAGPASTVSFAVRWHGERPAILWECSGDPVALTSPALAPAWTSTEASGEALWEAPRAPRSIRAPLAVDVAGSSGETASFS